MPDELSVTVTGSDGLLGPTRDALQQQITRYGQGLLDEARRLEALNRTGGGPAQVTIRDVQDADFILRRNLSPPKKDLASKLLWLTASASGIATGWFGNQTNETWGLIGLLVSAGITLVTGLLGYLK